jgi:hypothetical protein
MSYYTRKQILEMVETDDGFLIALEQEEILVGDAPADSPGEFSERMLERVRVAQNLVRDLEVNMAGAAVIVRMREEMADLRRYVEELLAEVKRRTGS